MRLRYIGRLCREARRIIRRSGNCVVVDEEVSLCDTDDVTGEPALVPFNVHCVYVDKDNAVVAAISYKDVRPYGGISCKEVFNEPVRDFSPDDCEKILSLVAGKI